VMSAGSVSICNEFPDNCFWESSFSQPAGADYVQSAAGGAVNPTPKASGRRPLAYLSGGPGAKPPGGCGVDGGGPQRR
jgi:hypothetical protein